MFQQELLPSSLVYRPQQMEQDFRACLVLYTAGLESRNLECYFYLFSPPHVRASAKKMSLIFPKAKIHFLPSQTAAAVYEGLRG